MNTLTTTEATYTLGSPTDTWGHSWSLNELSNANFRVRVINIASDTARDFSLDWAAVRVYYNDVPVPAAESLYPFGMYEVENGTPTRYYMFNGQAVALRTGAEPVTYLHRDQVGSVVMTTQNGVAVDSRQYFAYGSKRGGDDYPFEPDYTGQRRDGTGLLYYNARYYDPELAMFISPDSMIPEPSDYFSYNRYLYARGNPLKYNDPSGHDPLDDGWRTEFKGSHGGREPDVFDESIRLFMLAYPFEGGYNRFYDANGERIVGAQQAIFQTNMPDTRSWNTLGDALTRLSAWYYTGEEAMFIQDITFLFAGTPSRSQDEGITYWQTQPNYEGNIHAFVNPGTLDPKYYLNTDGSKAANDADMNVHHWVWGVALGYNVGLVAGNAINTSRELESVDYDVNKVNMSDLHLGSAGIATGSVLWWHIRDIPSAMYPFLEMAP